MGKVPRGTVGWCAASQRQEPSEQVASARTNAEANLTAKKDARRQKVWDKLDSARKAADEQSCCAITSFQPAGER